MCGKPVIKGTRIPVDLILRKLSQGITEDGILASYPRLTRADVRAAIRYAADLMAFDESALLPTAR